MDALVDHFLRFKTEERLLPVVWQQTLLCFVQRCVARGWQPGGAGGGRVRHAGGCRRGCTGVAARAFRQLLPHATPASCLSQPTPHRHCRLLQLACRYKTEVRAEDKTALRDLVKRQHHYALTPEILRELDSSRSRGEAAPAPDAGAPVSKVAAAGGSGEDPRDLAPIIMMDD